ncbi:hypothetical protein FHX37_2791 [Haloactinospora alba]|uniref:Type VII secretion system (Wss) protein ESAT-6 n=1 Tax=Haloactinospora alba TaxID=405555 RepID=A0A543NLU6_9ACTN|nr:hypothetical protein [Haloactinospora alba]TQN32808.1 hypothetical protein FHX37_2791 [Haloactinospora alba]
MGDIGMNPDSAQEKGKEAESLAAGFRDLELDFSDALQAAKAASGSEPGVSGWNGFADKQSNQMSSVEKQGLDLAENVQSGAAEGANTDNENANKYSGARYGLSRNINIR